MLSSPCKWDLRFSGTFVCLFLVWQPPQWAMASSFTRFLDHTQRRITVGRTPLDEWSARRRDLYLTTHNTHNEQISMPTPLGFEPIISAGERPQTYALNRPVTGTGLLGRYATWPIECPETSVKYLRRVTSQKSGDLFCVLFAITAALHWIPSFIYITTNTCLTRTALINRIAL